MSATCGCCSGIAKLTPVVTINRPGLPALRYRAGTHGSFLQTMKARLSSMELSPEDFHDAAAPLTIEQLRPLLALTTRESSDPAIALLDAWALVADVLTFYQERIANEGYLRTATERRSILELARLIGYRLRPGVAASVYLAYTLEPDSSVVIPEGSRAQSKPGPGELPQSFETSADLAARTEWNLLVPRTTRPQRIVLAQALTLDELYFEGVTTRLKTNDPLLLVFGNGAGQQVVRRARTVEPDAAANRTRVTLVPRVKTTAAPDPTAADMLADVHAIARRYKKVAKTSGASRKAVVRRIVATLDRLLTLGEDDLGNELAPEVEELQRQLEEAQEGGFARLVPWIEQMVTDLGGAAATTHAIAAARALTTSPASAAPTADQRQELRLTALAQDPSTPPASSQSLGRSVTTAFAATSDAGSKLLATLRPSLATSLYQALGNVAIPAPPTLRVFALRIAAPLFGYNATPTRPPELAQMQTRPATDDQWHVVDPVYALATAGFTIVGENAREAADVVHLDASYESIVEGSWIVVDVEETPLTPQKKSVVARVGSVKASVGRGVYGLSGKTTDVRLVSPADETTAVPWIASPLTLPVDSHNDRHVIEDDFEVIRSTTVYAQSELLALADAPIDPVANPVEGNRIELADLVSGLETGRWLLVHGERVDIPDVAGIHATELAMLAGVEQAPLPPVPGEKTHSTLVLANDLSYRYRLDTVTVYGNVVHATHGERRTEVLGSGDASVPMQELALRQSPLTYVSAATPAGAESTLEVRVNDVLWHEVDSLVGLGPHDRRYITSTDDDDKTTVIFGDGWSGARPATGRENVKSVYRTGIGAPGNVDAEQITLLATRPLNVKSVVNPLPATGGANREDRDTARRNAPMAVMALDRLISAQDYEDFARTFAGIGKASAARLSDGRRQVVHLTIAGADDIPIATTSDLFLNLRTALLKYGDPSQALQIVLRKLSLLLISAKVKIDSDYLWEAVEPKIRAALLDTFSFAKRELGQDAVASEAISVIQAQDGVAYVDLEIFDSVSEDLTAAEIAGLGTSVALQQRIRAHEARAGGTVRRLSRILPAELVYLSGAIPETLILTEVTS
jgi:Baseplate J-like protein